MRGGLVYRSCILVNINDECVGQVHEPLQRHCATVAALKQSLSTQQEMRRQYLAAMSAVDKKRAQGESPSLSEFEEVAARARQEYESSTTCISEDFDRYKRERGSELIRIVKEMATCQAEHCRRVGDLWSSLIPQLAMCQYGESQYGIGNVNPNLAFAEAVPYNPSAPVQKVYSYVDSNVSRSSMYDVDDDDVIIGV